MYESEEGFESHVVENGWRLSEGIRRRLALARAQTTEGKLVVIDEPTESLDAEGAKAVHEILGGLAKAKRTIIIMSHDPNIVKVLVEGNLKDDNFLNAKDFFRTKKDFGNQKIYHHIGIYAFTNIALTKYVNLTRSKLEIERNLEQMRAMDNNFVIKVGMCNSTPLSVDTKDDLIKVSEEMARQ